MTRYPLLEICARIDGHSFQHDLLRKYCRNVENWPDILQGAEQHGMSPLLNRHLTQANCDCPRTVRRSLSILAKRHTQTERIRFRMLREVLTLFRNHQLQPLLIKGAALAYSLYPEPWLRPMRDMDILLPPSEVDSAQAVLREAGFTQAGTPIPADHFHLPSLHKTVEDTHFCIELHRGLYPNCPPYYPSVDVHHLLRTAKPIAIGDIPALTLSNEETLHYLYQHGFRMPLTYEPYKLINGADLIGFTEYFFDTLDWSYIGGRYPVLLDILPALHHIAPWNFDKVPRTFLGERQLRRKLKPIPFEGWPQQRRKQLRAKGEPMMQTLRNTFLPSRWWLNMYYGANTLTKCVKTLCYTHPRTLFWWFTMQRHLEKMIPSRKLPGC